MKHRRLNKNNRRPVELRSTKLLTSHVAGLRYYPAASEHWDEIDYGDLVRLMRERYNGADSNAIAVYWNHLKVGYLPREKNEVIAWLMDEGVAIETTIAGKDSYPKGGRRLNVQLIIDALVHAPEVRSVCPKCNEARSIPIFYGRTVDTAYRDGLLGRALLRGCFFDEVSPTRHCRPCGHEWGPTGECESPPQPEDAIDPVECYEFSVSGHTPHTVNIAIQCWDEAAEILATSERSCNGKLSSRTIQRLATDAEFVKLRKLAEAVIARRKRLYAPRDGHPSWAFTWRLGHSRGTVRQGAPKKAALCELGSWLMDVVDV